MSRETHAKRPSTVRRIVGVFLTLRGRLILLVCFATGPAILFIFFVAAKERESALARMQTEALHLAASPLGSTPISSKERGAFFVVSAPRSLVSASHEPTRPPARTTCRSC